MGRRVEGERESQRGEEEGNAGEVKDWERVCGRRIGGEAIASHFIHELVMVILLSLLCCDPAWLHTSTVLG